MGICFSYERITEPEGICLYCQKDDEEWLSVDVYPGMGFKTAGLCYRGQPLQPFRSRWTPLLSQDIFGNNVLFPTPNRVRDHTFTFQGRQVEMIKNGLPRSQHGVALDSKWNVVNLEIRADRVLAEAVFEIRKGDENYHAFPYECVLRGTYTLTENSLSFRYRVKNISDRPMPFGIGLHPWFLLPQQEEILLQMPAACCYETTDDLLPTGRMRRVKEYPDLDLNRFRRVRELDLDTVYLTGGKDVIIRYPKRRYQIRIRVSEEFQMGVVFTAFCRGLNKEGYEAFCVESQSCCTDAINLHERGFKESGLMILSPGQEKTGEIQYIFEEIGMEETGEEVTGKEEESEV